MLFKTRGIVLSYTKFKESSIIVRIFTEQFGLQSYIVNGLRSMKSKKGMALYQPLTLLDMVVYYKSGGRGISRISEVKCISPFYSIPFEIKKSTIAIFLTDLLTNLLKDGEENPEEFNYIFHSVEYLDQIKTKYENFHLEFMVGMSKFLGFGILDAKETIMEIDDHSIDAEVEIILQGIIDKSTNLMTTNEGRKKTMSFLLIYYRNHLDTPLNLKSIKILNQVFA